MPHVQLKKWTGQSNPAERRHLGCGKFLRVWVQGAVI